MSTLPTATTTNPNMAPTASTAEAFPVRETVEVDGKFYEVGRSGRRRRSCSRSRSASLEAPEGTKALRMSAQPVRKESVRSIGATAAPVRKESLRRTESAGPARMVSVSNTTTATAPLRTTSVRSTSAQPSRQQSIRRTSQQSVRRTNTVNNTVHTNHTLDTAATAPSLPESPIQCAPRPDAAAHAAAIRHQLTVNQNYPTVPALVSEESSPVVRVVPAHPTNYQRQIGFPYGLPSTIQQFNGVAMVHDPSTPSPSLPGPSGSSSPSSPFFSPVRAVGTVEAQLRTLDQVITGHQPSPPRSIVTAPRNPLLNDQDIMYETGLLYLNDKDNMWGRNDHRMMTVPGTSTPVFVSDSTPVNGQPTYSWGIVEGGRPSPIIELRPQSPSSSPIKTAPTKKEKNRCGRTGKSHTVVEKHEEEFSTSPVIADKYEETPQRPVVPAPPLRKTVSISEELELIPYTSSPTAAAPRKKKGCCGVGKDASSSPSSSFSTPVNYKSGAHANSSTPVSYSSPSPVTDSYSPVYTDTTPSYSSPSSPVNAKEKKGKKGCCGCCGKKEEEEEEDSGSSVYSAEYSVYSELHAPIVHSSPVASSPVTPSTPSYSSPSTPVNYKSETQKKKKGCCGGCCGKKDKEETSSPVADSSSPRRPSPPVSPAAAKKKKGCCGGCCGKDKDGDASPTSPDTSSTGTITEFVPARPLPPASPQTHTAMPCEPSLSSPAYVSGYRSPSSSPVPLQSTPIHLPVMQ